MKEIVALVLAGGRALEFRSVNGPYHKPLLPVHGRPVAEYVIKALEESAIEKIFVLHDRVPQIHETLMSGDKCIFLEKNGHQTSFGAGILFAFEKIAGYYGPTELHKKQIMIVACDTPLVTGKSFNSVIKKVKNKNADVIITIINRQLLKKRFPGGRFRGVYLADQRKRYTSQNVVFIDGACILFKESPAQGELKISVRGWNEEMIRRLEETIDSLRNHRKHFYQFVHFIHEFFVRRLARNGHGMLLLNLLFSLALRRLTMAKVTRYISATFQVRVDYIESEEAVLSGDIDRPGDFPAVLGVSWNGGSAD
jgi:molybdopterin-guanine dinucleotide biosynthesis protein A